MNKKTQEDRFFEKINGYINWWEQQLSITTSDISTTRRVISFLTNFKYMYKNDTWELIQLKNWLNTVIHHAKSKSSSICFENEFLRKQHITTLNTLNLNLEKILKEKQGE